MSGSFLTLTDDGQMIPLDGSCPIGRQAGNRLLLPGERVSRQHALIQWQRSDETGTGAFLLIDLGSSNGTMLNGARITRPSALADGDIIDRFAAIGQPPVLNTISNPTAQPGYKPVLYRFRWQAARAAKTEYRRRLASKVTEVQP